MDEKKQNQCKPVDMQDHGPKASQENPDPAEKFHVEHPGPGITTTKQSDDSAQPSPGITTTKIPG